MNYSCRRRGALHWFWFALSRGITRWAAARPFCGSTIKRRCSRNRRQPIDWIILSVVTFSGHSGIAGARDCVSKFNGARGGRSGSMRECTSCCAIALWCWLCFSWRKGLFCGCEDRWVRLELDGWKRCLVWNCGVNWYVQGRWSRMSLRIFLLHVDVYCTELNLQILGFIRIFSRISSLNWYYYLWRVFCRILRACPLLFKNFYLRIVVTNNNKWQIFKKEDARECRNISERISYSLTFS